MFFGVLCVWGVALNGRFISTPGVRAQAFQAWVNDESGELKERVYRETAEARAAEAASREQFLKGSW